MIQLLLFSLLASGAMAASNSSDEFFIFGNITIDCPLLQGQFEIGYLKNGSDIEFEAILSLHLVG